MKTGQGENQEQRLQLKLAHDCWTELKSLRMK